ncbi:MAG: ATPase [Gammaproteobacteria bacterium]|nr:ATPase [Gammaproteobacteria bacterium]NIR84021.1 ATPase [Gammaproteobacteria bacterium]NIR89165.1 ATPase [Gammaproteobacteria bacterium]NIU04967.1 ATPase [Gammaproteobacteria bacterium]NIV52133.1 ATPase [Gammaproteobacteria bacterium]
MRMRREDFVRWENKAVTLLGMSGVGKTVLANRLPKATWFHYSGDYRIGTKYLEEPILDNIKRQAMQVPFLRELLRSDCIYIRANITVDNLKAISTFLGKAGDPQRGGLPLAEFKRRQQLHREAEIRAMNDVEPFIVKAREIYGYPHLINDAGGSVCELEDEPTVQTLARNTLIVYIRADKEMEEKLIQRQIEHPKPLYYSESFFDEQLQEYLDAEKLSSVEQLDPDRFVRWIFPRLVEHRRPRYQALANRYGYTVEARDAEQVRNESDFIELVGDALQKKRAIA